MEFTSSLVSLGLLVFIWPGTTLATICTSYSYWYVQRYTASTDVIKTLTSPNYPLPYDSNKECSWVIESSVFSDTDYIVKVVFNDFMLTPDPNRCQYDSLKFYDGPSSMYPLLGSFCGTVRPDVIYSSGRSLYIKFHSDLPPNIYKGFRFSYSAVKKEEASAICRPGVPGIGSYEKSLTDTSGTFFSPNFPVPYPKDHDCIWRITAPVGKRVKLSFEHFELSASAFGCREEIDHADYVSVKDGSSSDNFVIGLYCASNTSGVPPVVYSSGRYMRVSFHSDDVVKLTRGKGFKARYEAVDQPDDLRTHSTKLCYPGNTNNDKLRLTGDKGTLKSSPLKLYPPSLRCNWLITVPYGNTVKLTFNKFKLDWNTNGLCGDYVEVLDGEYTFSKSKGKYCGDVHSPPGPVSSSGRYMTVKFRSDARDQRRAEGFEATFTAVDKSDAGFSAVAVSVSVSVSVGFVSLVILCIVCIAKWNRTRNRAAGGARMTMMTSTTTASHTTQPPPPTPQTPYQPAHNPYPPPPVGYAPLPANPTLPPPECPYPETPPPPYPGVEETPQYPPPGQPYPWIQHNAPIQPSAPPWDPAVK